MRTSLVAIAAAMLSTPAVASGPAPAPVEPEIVAPAEPAFTWTGPYAGVQLGMLNGNIDWTNPEGAENDAPEGVTASPDADGFVGGLYGGYNWQSTGNTVFGVEAEYNWSHADGSDDIVLQSNGNRVGGVLESEITSTAAVRGRVGYAMDRTLIYGTGGVAWASLDLDVAERKSNPSWSDTMTGWTIGAGVEHAFTDSMVGRVDYRYSDYGEEDDFDGSGASVEMDTHEVRVGVAYRF